MSIRMKNLVLFMTLTMISSRLLLEVNALATLPPLTPYSDPIALLDTHYFSATSNWLIPGHIMQGRHPGSGRGSATERVRAIVQDAGCTTFVCLQAECPPPDGSCTSFGGSNEWKTNPMPGFTSYVQDARQAAAESSGSKPEPKFVHFGIRDMNTAESLEELTSFVNHLKERVLHDDEVLYCHCWGGKGRAGLILACLLGALYADMTADEALERVQTYCSLRNRGIGTQLKSPETDAQKEQVREYYALRS